MRRALPSVLPWAVLVGASTLAFIVLRARDAGGDGWSWSNPTGHFWIVSAAALLCVLLALVSGIAASRAANWRVTLIAMSFIAMAGIFAVHGLATPGFIVDRPGGGESAPEETALDGDAIAGNYGYAAAGYGAAASRRGGGVDHGAYLGSYFPNPGVPPSMNGGTDGAGTAEGGGGTRFYDVTGVSSRLAILASIALLAAAAVRWPAAVEGWLTRRRHAVLGLGVAAVLTYAVLAFTAPWLVPEFVVQSGTAAWATTGVVGLLGAMTAMRFGNSYRISGVQMHGAAAVGAVLIVQAQLSVHLGATWSGIFWLYHLQLLGAFFAIFWGIVIEYSRGQTVRALESLTVSDVLEQLRSGFAEPVVALSAALEARDGYTLGHGERVAALAVLIGRELRLSPRRLRAIAAGSLLHDVGKIGVPDAVLHKHGSLSEEEYAVIKEHPTRGAEMLRHHFDQKTEANVIRHHHERWDGSGYPDGLSGDAIPLEARVVAVADVYDALRSNRAYRDAFPRDEAVAIMLDAAGTHLDPECVRAFLQVVDEWEGRYADDHQAYAERRVA